MADPFSPKWIPLEYLLTPPPNDIPSSPLLTFTTIPLSAGRHALYSTARRESDGVPESSPHRFATHLVPLTETGMDSRKNRDEGFPAGEFGDCLLLAKKVKTGADECRDRNIS